MNVILHFKSALKIFKLFVPSEDTLEKNISKCNRIFNNNAL